MSLTAFRASLPPLMAKEFEFADLIAQGKVEEGMAFYETIQSSLPQDLVVKTKRLVKTLNHFKDTPEWAVRSKEMGTIFKHYTMINWSERLPVGSLMLSTFSDNYNSFYYPIIYVIQSNLFLELFDHEESLIFLDKKLIPAFLTYFTTGCLEPLQEALESIQDKNPGMIANFLAIIKNYSNHLKDPISAWLPERNFPGCFQVKTLQSQLVEEILPFWKQIWKILFGRRGEEYDKKMKQFLQKPDQSVQQAKVGKIEEEVSPQFFNLFKKTFNKAVANFCKIRSYEKVLEKFYGDTSGTFGQYRDNIEFALDLYNRMKEIIIFIRDFDFFRFTYNMKQLEEEWNRLKEQKPLADFEQFIRKKIAVITEKWEAGGSKKWSLLGKWLKLTKEDPTYCHTYYQRKYYLEYYDFQIGCFSLFKYPLEIGTAMGMSDDFDDVSPSIKVKEDKKKEERENKEDIPPPTKAKSTVASSTAPPAAPVVSSKGIVPLFSSKHCRFRQKAAQRSFDNGSLHLENLSALITRVRQFPDNIFPTFAFIGATLATAIENFQKSYIHDHGASFPRNSHNLFGLLDHIPFIPFGEVRGLRYVNFAERDMRYIVETSPRDRQTPFQRDLRDVYTNPKLSANVGRVRRLFATTLSVLCRLAKQEERAPEVTKKAMELITETATFAALPPRHPEIMGIVESLSKLLSIIPVNEDNQRKLLNLQNSLLVMVREEANLHPAADGMRIHYSMLFRLLPLITEELIKLLFIKRGVGRSPFEFRHNLINMLKEAKMNEKDLKPAILHFLTRIPEYARMQRYPIRATYKDKHVKHVADCIRLVQGKTPNPIDKGFKPTKGSPDEAFQELEKALLGEFKLLEEFTSFITKLL